MLELAQQLSYYLSVVDRGATSKLVEFGQKLASVGIIAQTAKASIDSMVAPLQRVAGAWSGREQQINNITRSLRQYQYVGQSIVDINRDIARSMPGSTEAQRGARFTEVYRQQFNDARGTARGVIGEMSRMAAQLPGELNDYMQTFAMNLPHLSQVRGMTLGRATRLSSTLAAGGIAGGVDAGQTGRDLMQFLTVGPHMMDRAWTEVWSQYATRNGRRVTAEQIRGMTGEQRVEVLENIAAQLQPMMDATADSYDAILGTWNSLRHEIYLGATEPLFDAWKRMLNASNLALANFMPTIVKVGQFFSTILAGRIDAFTRRIPAMGEALGNFGNRLFVAAAVVNGVVQGLHTMSGALRGLVADDWPQWRMRFNELFNTGRERVTGVGVQAGNIWDQYGNAIVRMLATAAPTILLRVLGVSLGPIGWLLPGVLGRVLTGANAGNVVSSFATAVGTILTSLVPLGVAMYQLYDTLMTLAATVASFLLPVLLDGFGVGVATVAGLLTALAEGLLANIGTIGNFLLDFGYGLLIVYQLLRPIGWLLYTAFIQPLIEIGRLFTGTNEQLDDGTLSLQENARALQEFYVELRALIDWIKSWLGGGTELNLRQEGGVDVSPDRVSRMRDFAGVIGGAFDASNPPWAQRLQELLGGSNAGDTFNGALRPHTTDHRRPSVHQDFRYSRFDITQKFAEGFSPERVGAAFTSDLEAMANQRLSSGLAPAFTSG